VNLTTRYNSNDNILSLEDNEAKVFNKPGKMLNAPFISFYPHFLAQK